MTFQKTLKTAVSLSGIGLHSGKTVPLKIRPGRPNQGIVFLRSDLKDSTQILATYDNVRDTRLATTIGHGKITISTVEHLMSALHGLQIDNAIIEVGGPEVPVFDGSSLEIYRAIQRVGVETQMQPKSVLNVIRRVELRVDDKWAVVEPSDVLELEVSIEWDHPAIGFQEFYYQEGITSFDEIAPARTFGFLRDVESLKRMGLAQGGSLENAIVLDDGRVLNPEGLRFPDEFVRHKVLDALGDFKLAGVGVQGHFRLHRPGHELHYQLLQTIFKDPRNYELSEGIYDEPSHEIDSMPAIAIARAY